MPAQPPAPLPAPARPKSFFSGLFGFDEQTGSRAAFEETQAELFRMWNESKMSFSTPRGEVRAGYFFPISVAELRKSVRSAMDKLLRGGGRPRRTNIRVVNTVGEAGALHRSAEMNGGVFQVASQFNCLEFPNQRSTPELGITDYIHDRTQGPACAIACPAGTAVRNYLVKWEYPSDINSADAPPPGVSPRAERLSRGQAAFQQIDCSLPLQRFMIGLLNDKPAASEGPVAPADALWFTVNGYLDSDPARLKKCAEAVEIAEAEGRVADLCGSLAVGVQYETDVCDPHGSPIPGQNVTQVFGSAVAVGYSVCAGDPNWRSVAETVLKATYEGTLLVGILQNLKRIRAGLEPVPVQLTKIGGGVFANPQRWIIDSINYAVRAVAQHGFPFEAHIVHYGSIEAGYEVLAR